jgi:hypothetical protein
VASSPSPSPSPSPRRRASSSASAEKKRGSAAAAAAKPDGPAATKAGLSAPTWLVLVAVLMGFVQVLVKQGLLSPVDLLVRNVFMAPQPPPVEGKYTCTPESIAADVTVVVTVKDACSQAPGFIKALNKMMPTQGVHLIYTYPNFSSCAGIPGLQEELSAWEQHGEVTPIPLEPRVSPMQGWVDAVDHIKTPYALLLHNDGYALDPFFTCELVGALKARKTESSSSNSNSSGSEGVGGPFVVAAPMLYESKADKSLAAHATQSNLRLVTEYDKSTNRTVRHDHSVARALNRGQDIPEGPQSEFLEDHGFMIETDKIRDVIDPHASYTLEYIDMIMTIRSHGWQVLFVPTARLEFRITEFSWRDIPYFMYKRSEATCHGTRDYLLAVSSYSSSNRTYLGVAPRGGSRETVLLTSFLPSAFFASSSSLLFSLQKWGADFPNTGFWTYIKYTIVEQHVYDEVELGSLSWAESASIAFGFFQMAGFNRYQTAKSTLDAAGLELEPPVDYIEVLQRLERGWAPPDALSLVEGPMERGAVAASRELARKGWRHNETKPTTLKIEEILETRAAGAVRIEADMPLEYLPFAVLELSFPVNATTGAVDGLMAATLDAVKPLCGLLVKHAAAPLESESDDGASLSCWVNLPTFKSNGLLIQFLDRLAALIKLPSRVTTYIEMFMGSTNAAAGHVKALQALIAERSSSSSSSSSSFPSARLAVCEHDGDCDLNFAFGRHSRVLQFVGKPPSAWEVLQALKK